MSYPGQVFEDPEYYDDDFYYDLDEEGNWVEVKVDADGNPIPLEPEEVFGPYITVNS